MKGRYTLVTLLVCLLGVAGVFTASAQRKTPTFEEMQDVNGAQGTEFWIAIPPNEIPGYPVIGLEVYVASAYDTEVNVYEAETGRRYKKTIKKGEIRTLSDTRGETNWSWEIRNAEVPETKAIQLTSKKPISVYVVSSKVFTSDGYLALPTSVWGRDYIVTSYYDFREIQNWPGGFVIVAKDDGTIVDINLKGQGESDATTSGGRKINTGQPFSVTLEKGGTYLVQGDGLTRAVFDMSGTSIKSNKPIGLLSFHMRTTMPNLLYNGNGRNYLVEMTPPVTAWGKRYVTVEYSRNHLLAGRGDMFRVIASQAQTRITLEYFDKNNKRKLGGSGFVLNKPGDFIDLSQSADPTALPEGVSIWTADKPIFVMQYSCSSSWDGDITLDPFMINVTPVEQFIPTTIFQSPTMTSFSSHKLNLIVQADTSSPNLINDLKSLMIDDKPTWNDNRAISPTLLFNRINGTDLYWTTVDFQTDGKSHTISSNGSIKFGGYIYGYGQTDAYGWPAAAAFKPTGIQDTMRPLFKQTVDCGDWTVDVTELRNIPDPPLPVPKDSDQVETGVAEIRFMDDTVGRVSTNYDLVMVTDQNDPLPRDPSYKKFQFKVNVIDKSKDAIAYIYIKDWANNVSYDTVFYFADKVTFNPTPVDFGRVRVGRKVQQSVKISNASDSKISITSVKLKTGSTYSIIGTQIPPAIDIPAKGSVDVVIEYDAKEETTDPATDFDIDTVIVKTVCSEFKVPITGIAVQPRIRIDDFHAGILGVGEQRCKTGGLFIENPGTDALVITSFRNVGSNFTLSSPTTPPLPITVAPRGSVYVTSLCYSRADIGKDSIDVSCETNDAVGDSVSTWDGEVQAPGPLITNYDWLKRRVNTVKAASIRLTNSGQQVITVTDINFVTGGKYFPNGTNDNNYVFKITGYSLNGTPVTGNVDIKGNGTSAVDTIVINLEFRPEAEQTYAALVVPTFQNNTVTAPNGRLDGVGILPKIQTTGNSWTCAESPEGNPVVKDIVIVNPSTTEDLIISNLAFAAGTDPAFVFAGGPPNTPITVPMNNGRQTIGIQFTRPVGGQGTYNASVNITHNGKQGNFPTVKAEAPVPPDTLSVESVSVGGCSGPDIAVTNIDFGRKLANCDLPEAEFTITNTGAGLKPLRIESITPVDADAAAFTIVSIFNAGGTAVTPPLLITPGESYRVLVRFTPTEPNAAPWADRPYSARFHIVNYVDGDATELKPNTYATVIGTGFVVPVSMSISNTTTAGQTIKPGEEISLSVAGNSNSWNLANLTSFTATMLYDQRTMAYTDGSIIVGAQAPGWTIGVPTKTVVNDSTERLTFVATGGAPLSANGELFRFRAISLLSANFTFYQNLEVAYPRACVIPSTTGDSTTIYNCALTKRVVTLGKKTFNIGEISPNPSQGGEVALDVSIGFNTVTTIELMNQLGQVIRTLHNEMTDGGAYTLRFSTNDLGSGLYFVRMRSADYQETRRLIISN